MYRQNQNSTSTCEFLVIFHYNSQMLYLVLTVIFLIQQAVVSVKGTKDHFKGCRLKYCLTGRAGTKIGLQNCVEWNHY